MRFSATTIIAPPLIGFVLVLQACATGEGSKKLEAIDVVRVSSHSAVISRARVVQIEGRVVLEGELMHRYPVRGPIPGHIHVEVRSDRDEMVKTAKFTYPQGSGNSRTLSLRFSLPPDIPSRGVVRVIHHDGQSHAPPAAEPVWSDRELPQEP